MIIWVLQQLLLCRKALIAKDSPRQLAWGLALGMLIGLVPKGSLLAVALSLVLLGSRANIAIGMLGAVVFSFLGLWLDPLTHPLGAAVLEHPSLKPLWTRLYRLPLVPWTAFNNTVVFGSLILGSVLLYPLYRLALPYFERLERRRRAKESASREGAEWEGGGGGKPECEAWMP